MIGNTLRKYGWALPVLAGVGYVGLATGASMRPEPIAECAQASVSNGGGYNTAVSNANHAFGLGLDTHEVSALGQAVYRDNGGKQATPGEIVSLGLSPDGDVVAAKLGSCAITWPGIPRITV